MLIAIFSRLLKPNDLPYVQELFDSLSDLNIDIIIHRPYFEQLQGQREFPADVALFEGYEDLRNLHVDFMVSMGGDGTILEAVTIARDTGIPIAGINLGRLGFLASIEKGRIREAMQALVNGNYYTDDRSLLHLESNTGLFGDTNFALNDCTILKRDTSSMIIVHTYINGEFLNSYWADGIIISTPTGSTGYSLSCGGPIVFPNSGNFVITPVAPHNLTVRPIVISDSSVISFEIEGRAENFLCTLDSRFETINQTHQIAVRKADFSSKLVRLHDRNFLNTIRQKLAWGVDSRN